MKCSSHCICTDALAVDFHSRIKVWLQNLETAQKGGKNARDIQGEPAIVAGGGVPNGDVLVVGAGKLNKEAKADRVSEGPRPSTITVPEADFTVKETHPNLGNAVDYRQHHDLVEEMSYLFIRVVRARNLSGKDNNTLSDPVSFSLNQYRNKLQCLTWLPF